MVVMILQFQNCAAPVRPGVESAASMGDKNTTDQQDTGLPVSVIDPVQEQVRVLFPQPQLSVNARLSPREHVLGICGSGQSGIGLNWELILPNGHVLSQGQTLCDRGSFSVEVAVVELSCDSPSVLRAHQGIGPAGEIQLVRNCEAERAL